ncbi:MAG: hypothetical protein GY770_18860 [Aestuariibacter sp.]|nr:hypothetical protein [Aestuariibacter sp.]MCP5011497.1 hypothetical protein [Aestuariibacter sp.]
MTFKKASSTLAFAVLVSLSLPLQALPEKTGISAEITTKLLDEHFKQGDYEFVISALEDTSSKTPEQYNMLISALMNTDLDDAEEVAEEFIARYKDDYRAYHTHASVMGAQASSSIFSALGYAEKAKHSLEAAITVAPEEVKVYQALMQFHLMAPSIAGGDMEEAEKLADKIGTLDALEGQFAKAKFYLEDEQTEKASAIYATLSQQDETKIRASYELGSFYLSDERYEDAFNALSALLTASVVSVEDTESEAWEAYEKNKSNLLYGKYRLGQLAVESGDYTQSGITALEQYIEEYNATNIETTHLPSMNWAHLRLAELRLNANDVEQAKNALASIQGEEDKRFAKILKGLKKQLSKKA